MYCNYDSLHFTGESCIARCRQCGYFKIAFLSLVISLSEQEYKYLYYQVLNKHNESDKAPDSSVRNIFISIPSKDMHLMLMSCELAQLYRMMEEADCEMKAQQMLSLFNS